MLKDAIREYEEHRISETIYLKRVQDIMNSVLSRTDSEMPAELRSHDVARAFYGLTVELLSNKLSDRGIAKTISTACSLKIDEIIRNLVLDGNKPIVDWNIKTSITGKILIEIGDYLIDEVRDKYNLELSFDEMDELAEKCIEVAKVRYKG